MTDDKPQQTTHSILALGYCVFGLLAFAIQDTIVKSLTQRYPVLEVVSLRTFMVLILLLIVGLALHGKTILSCRRPYTLLSRGILAYIAFTTYYLALTVIPLAEAATVYMTAPLFVTALSVPLLGERVGWHRAIAVLIGFSAAVYIVSPSSELFQVATALPLLSALAYAMIPIITRRIGLSEHVLTMAIYTTVSYVFLCAVTAGIIYQFGSATPSDTLFGKLLAYWTVPTLGDFGLSLLAAAIFILGLLGLTHAYRVLPVSVVSPFEYSYILWAILLGFIAFGDVPGMRTVIGGIFIVACGCYVFYREQANKT